MRDLLDRQSAAHEARLAPKPEWLADKMTPEVLERMMRQIVPCKMRVDEIAGTWKLGQNKPDDVRLRTLDALEGRWMSHLAGPLDKGQIACALGYLDFRHEARHHRALNDQCGIAGWTARQSPARYSRRKPGKPSPQQATPLRL
jgi:hypothetical protein